MAPLELGDFTILRVPGQIQVYTELCRKGAEARAPFMAARDKLTMTKARSCRIWMCDVMKRDNDDEVLIFPFSKIV